jgi:hypothetical protein
VFQVPPPTLGIRVIGVNMIHGVPDKLNIYVKRVLEGSVAGLDGRIRVNDHIVEVRITLVPIYNYSLRIRIQTYGFNNIDSISKHFSILSFGTGRSDQGQQSYR